MDTLARIVIIGLCVVAVAGCLVIAIGVVERRGPTIKSIAAVAACLVVGALAVWAIAAVVGSPTADAKPAGNAGNAGPVVQTLGVAGKG